MKRIIVVTVALAFVLLSAGAALAAISGSKHDMRTHMSTQPTGGWDEVCVYCHTPHGSNASAQLWNRTNPANGAYAFYTSATMNVTLTGTIGVGSLLCMSCHDGTIAVDTQLSNSPNFGNPGTSTATKGLDANRKVQGIALLGTSLSNDHPVGFAYSDAIAGGDSTLNSLISVQGNTAVRLIGSPATQVECATCHDAHNTANGPFLRSSNAGSAMCIVCHAK